MYITKVAMECPFLFIFPQIGSHIIKLAMKCPTFFIFLRVGYITKLPTKYQIFFYFTQVHYFYIKKIQSKSQVVLHHKIHYLLLDVTNVSSIFNKLSI